MNESNQPGSRAERMKKLFLSYSRPPVIESAFVESPLHEAVSELDLDATERLLSEGADVNARDWYGATPLMAAVQCVGLEPELEELRDLASGKLMKRFEKSLDEPINSKPPGEMMKSFTSLLPSVATFRQQMREGKERKRLQADSDQTSEPTPLKQEETDLIKLLISSGADLEARDKEGHTALYRVASGGIVQVAELLLDAGAVIDAEDNDGLTPLMSAAAECKRTMVDFLLQRGANITLRTKQGGTVLTAAANGGSAKIVARLLEEGLDANLRSGSGGSALLAAMMNGYNDIEEQLRVAGAKVGFFEAVVAGDFKAAEELLSLEEDRRTNTDWGQPVLFWAARQSNARAIRFLSAHGVSVTEKDKRGRTPLMVASMNSDTDTLAALSEAGANPNAISMGSGFMPLSWAASSGDTENVRLLIEQGADVNHADDHNNTPLLHAVMHGRVDVARLLLQAGADPHKGMMAPMAFATMRGDTEMVRLLAEFGAGDVIVKDARGRGVSAEHLPGVKDNPELLNLIRRAGGTDMHEAVKAGDKAVVLSLLEQGRDVNGESAGRLTPLRQAVETGFTDIVSLLLERGADPNGVDIIGRTPLHVALQHGNLDAASLLIAKGADVNACSKSGHTPLLVAALVVEGAKRNKLIEFLLESGAELNLQEAAALGDVATLRALLDCGLSIDSVNKGNVTALLMASATGRTEIVEMLLTRHASIDIRDDEGKTPLTWAFNRGHEQVARLLLENGADIEGGISQHQDSETGLDFAITITPLQAAVHSCKRDTVLLALDNGADVNGQGMMGSTALHSAAYLPADKIEIMDLLLDRGAEVDCKDWHGKTPLMKAATEGSRDKVELLLRRGADRAAKDRNGDTALDLAAQSAKGKAVLDLLR